MKVFYHGDADGKAAAYIVSSLLDGKKDFFSMQYSDDFPLDIIEENEDVYILDFSISPEMMSELVKKTHNVVWVDHHVSAIEKLSNFSKIPGLRSVDYSGCELTWLWVYFKDKNSKHSKIEGHNIKITEDMLEFCPKTFRLIGDRDVWRFKFGDESKWLYEAFRLLGEPVPEDNLSWIKMLFKLDDLLQHGELLCMHTDMINKSIVDRFAYETYFHGERILVCNSSISGSTLFGDKIKDYPFVAVYCYNGNKWSIGLYSEKMDVVDIAKEHGGGGHPRACGFETDTVPFSR